MNESFVDEERIIRTNKQKWTNNTVRDNCLLNLLFHIDLCVLSAVLDENSIQLDKEVWKKYNSFASISKQVKQKGSSEKPSKYDRM